MRFRFISFVSIFLLFITAQAHAQSLKSFAVLPFEVHGPQEFQYLSQGIQSMLSSRLTRTGMSSSISPGEISRQTDKYPESTAQAREIRSLLGADYLVYGTITIMDREASLDVFTVGADQDFEPILSQPSLSSLIPNLEEVANDLLASTLPHKKLAVEPEPVESAPEPPPAPPAEGDLYTSPHFRFEDDPYAAGRWRSRTLSFSSVGMAIGSDSDGRQTIFLLGTRKVHAFRFQDGRMMPIAEHSTPLTFQNLNINTFDLTRDGSHEIIISSVQDERSRSFILSFENNEFQVLHERIPFYMNLVRLPPDYRLGLIGQRPATGTRIFNPGTVQEVFMTSSGPELGHRLSLPPNANVFNFNYLPEEGSHLVVVAENDLLKVYNASHNLLYTTSDEYAGSSLGLEYYETMPGLARGSDQEPDYYFIPNRLLPVRFGTEDKYNLLTHKHYAGLSRFLARQRNFAEGEIRALFWDEIGLNVRWSTRKINASVVDFGIYDFDGDGQEELVVLLNTHPGITGLQDKKTIVLAYKMDFDSIAGSD